MGPMMALAAASMVTGAASSYMSAREAKKQARKARESAEEQRRWYTQKARETKRALNREIDTMRTVRSLDLPGFQQAAKVASIQRQKGFELAQRRHQLGRLPEDYRRAVFGGELNQYLGREAQKLQHYAQMSQSIFEATSRTQEEVNKMFAQGGATYSEQMALSQKMAYEAGDPTAKTLGAFAQGLSMAASEYAETPTEETPTTEPDLDRPRGPRGEVAPPRLGPPRGLSSFKRPLGPRGEVYPPALFTF